ncbi:hypothetical protein CY34DRAFT_108823 [Suillus luteus UH-Slu-Lm8-n1]|uniref:Uncharacterized protein n=1 Tax=Suillus luteus UH-Slu-Lm8-n1 TaxID=930992 RepID=A0A0D0AIY7_9AGAM|nr:hypothetical protein CY34DRAFT_108823 [Suillus luteus UH-Slu-Lm8-n1]
MHNKLVQPELLQTADLLFTKTCNGYNYFFPTSIEIVKWQNFRKSIKCGQLSTIKATAGPAGKNIAIKVTTNIIRSTPELFLKQLITEESVEEIKGSDILILILNLNLNLNLNSVNPSGSPAYIMQNVLELYIIEENLQYLEVVFVKI